MFRFRFRTSWETAFSVYKVKTFAVSTGNDSNIVLPTGQPDKNSPYVSLNFGFMAATMVTTVYRTFQFFHLCLSASIALHSDLFLTVLRAKMKFFDLNPSGRILKRFSKDLMHIDTRLPQALIEFVTVSIEACVRTYVVSSHSYTFIFSLHLNFYRQL